MANHLMKLHFPHPHQHLMMPLTMKKANELLNYGLSDDSQLMDFVAIVKPY
jgi:hypothetical protein